MWCEQQVLKCKNMFLLLISESGDGVFSYLYNCAFIKKNKATTAEWGQLLQVF